MKIPLRLIAALLFARSLVWADIAPSEFIGSGIAPRPDSAIRMEKAKVEIVWGTPCSLTATFTMVNTAAEAQEEVVGFPLPADDSDIPQAKPPHDLTMSFDGEVAPVVPPSANPEDRDQRRDWVWYHCKHKFKPGTTTVIVKTSQRASLVSGAPFRERLLYCIQTGGAWAGPIGEEEVLIRFPYPIARDQITQAMPSNSEVEGSTVRWCFTHIEPTGKEYDIALTYVRPDAMQTLLSLRAELAQNPDSSAAALKLARHLLALGYAKSNSGYPPSYLTKEMHAAILTRIAVPEDQKIFIEHYRWGKDGHYEEVSSEWTKERETLIQILADAGYRDDASRQPFVLEGERLIQDTLARHPLDAAAWNVYLANYWRFSFAAVGHWFGPTRLSREQAKLIETAAERCPGDEFIQQWLDLKRNFSDKLKTAKRLEAIKQKQQQVFIPLDFPKPGYGYY